MNGQLPTTKDPAVPNTARLYATEIKNRLGRHVMQVILFGSHARGDATPESDFDFVVVLDSRRRELRERVVDAGAALMEATDQLCAALVYDADQWRRVQQSPLGWNIAREGIAL